MNTHNSTFSQRLKTFALWGTLVGITFFTVYPTTNWLTSLRENHFEFYSTMEFKIPFMANFIWFYFSMYLLFMLPPFFLDPPNLRRLGIELIVATVISGLIFLVFPAKLGFSRAIPNQPLYREIYSTLFAIDHPFNLLPSLHVVYSSTITLSVTRNMNTYLRVIMLFWLSMIISSAVLTHQHHVTDLIVGLLLTVCVSFLWGRNMLKKLCCISLFFFFGATALAAEDTDHAIHEELRAVLRQTEEAINTGDFDKMLPVLSEQIRATPINQEFLSSRVDVSAYFKKWFGAGGYLKKLEMKLTPDTLTELSSDKSWGIVRGNGIEKYILTDGRPYEMKTRWTATMAKENDGQWRIRSIHIGTDFLNNPILSEAERALGIGVGGGITAGLLLGLLLGWLVFRKKKS